MRKTSSGEAPPARVAAAAAVEREALAVQALEKEQVASHGVWSVDRTIRQPLSLARSW